MKLQSVFAVVVAASLVACDCGGSKVDPRSLVVEPETLSLTAGGEAGTLAAKRRTGEDVTAQAAWSSSDEAVARVENGIVTPVAAGTAVITASLETFTAVANVAVAEATMLTPSCSDRLRNGTETDVDCGGSCPACGFGQLCTTNVDCASNRCLSGMCALPPSCTDGVKNGTETGLDCGGSCMGCGTGVECGAHADCTSGVCTNGTCQAPSCTDGVKNGAETAIDCGGGTCTGCGAGSMCTGNTDCASTVCINGVCQAGPTCMDGVRNGSESDVDCGGSCTA
ncbi:MAG TPA: Ig-like domain-containing protein, partial [Archangium sp.]